MGVTTEGTREQTVSIRKASLKDIPHIVRLSEQLGYIVSGDLVSRQISAISRDERHSVFVAVDSAERVLGWVHVALRTLVHVEPYAEIGGLVVDEKNRRQGIGRLLLGAAHRWAKGNRVATMMVWSNVIRVVAHEFYQNQGYILKKQQKVFQKNLHGDPFDTQEGRPQKGEEK